MTLIELLVVIAIIGILAMIMIPRFASMRERAYVAVMQADLNQLRTSQELFVRSGSPVYADDVAQLTSFDASPDVTILLQDRGDLEWAAEATHAGTSRSCTYESEVGTIVCDPRLDGDPNDDPPENDDPPDDGGDEDGDQDGEEGDGGWPPWK